MRDALKRRANRFCETHCPGPEVPFPGGSVQEFIEARVPTGLPDPRVDFADALWGALEVLKEVAAMVEQRAGYTALKIECTGINKQGVKRCGRGELRSCCADVRD